MNEGDKIIWDSHFGYEIGYFVGEGKLMGTYEVNLVTGVVHGNVSHSTSEIHEYNESNVTEMVRKYGYRKNFDT